MYGYGVLTSRTRFEHGRPIRNPLFHCQNTRCGIELDQWGVGQPIRDGCGIVT